MAVWFALPTFDLQTNNMIILFILSVIINVILVVICYNLIAKCKKYEGKIEWFQRTKSWYSEIPTNGRQETATEYDYNNLNK